MWHLCITTGPFSTVFQLLRRNYPSYYCEITWLLYFNKFILETSKQIQLYVMEDVGRVACLTHCSGNFNNYLTSHWIRWEYLLVNSQVLVDSLWPSDTIWRHKYGSTLAQVMACCLTAPSHYLNQCWLIISKASSIHLSEILQEIQRLSDTEITWKITFLKFVQISQGAKELTWFSMKRCCILC